MTTLSCSGEHQDNIKSHHGDSSYPARQDSRSTVVTGHICCPDSICVWMENLWQKSTLPSIGLRTVKKIAVLGGFSTRAAVVIETERHEVETPHFSCGPSIACRFECLGTSSLSPGPGPLEFLEF